jgi:hypothetical protein
MVICDLKAGVSLLPVISYSNQLTLLSESRVANINEMGAKKFEDAIMLLVA